MELREPTHVKKQKVRASRNKTPAETSPDAPFLEQYFKGVPAKQREELGTFFCSVILNSVIFKNIVYKKGNHNSGTIVKD